MKTQIKTKILRAFLGVSIISILLTGIAAGVIMLNIRDAALKSNADISQNAANSSEKALIAQAVSNMRELAEANSGLIDSNLSSVASNLHEIGNYINTLYTHEEEFREIKYQRVDQVTEGVLALQWCPADESIPIESIEHEAYLHGNLKYLYDSVMKENPDISTFYFSSESGVAIGYDAAATGKGSYYDGREAGWYTGARDKGDLVVSDTYQDVFGRGLTISMSLPCYGKEGKFVGVVGLDILIEELNEDIQKTSVLKDGYAMLFKGGSRVISASGLTEQNQDDINTFLGDNASDISKKMEQAKVGAQLTTLSDKNYYMAWSDIPISGWNYVVMVPEDSIVAPAVKNKGEIHELSDQAAQRMSEQIFFGIIIFIGLFVLIGGAVAFITAKISNGITKPISILNNEVKEIGNGNFNYVSHIKTQDEIEELSNSFESMTKELMRYIDNLSKVTADKERIATELNVATNIQSSMLPCIFPAFPERSEFDIYATMLPAKEVGGDFYDFFLVDEEHLGVVMADVSGKGVPAALFMVIAKTLIKNYAQMGLSPSEVFTKANNQLCDGNDAGMFVTAFMGVLNMKTGEFCYVNAGHNPPCIKRANGDYEFMHAPAGFVLAGMDGIRYKENTMTFGPNDSIYLYTDGVTEATDAHDELFSDPRLIEVLNQYKDDDLQDLLVNVKKEIDLFVGDAPQFDDITMLALTYKGGNE